MGFATVYRGESKHGKHVTIRMSDISYMNEEETNKCARAAAEEMIRMIPDKYKAGREKTLLVVCLGNRNITSDSQGPLCADILDATYHLKEAAPEIYRLMGEYRLAVLCPGTEGQSGIDPSVMTKCVCDKINPDAVIAADALAAGCDEYIGRTLQISSAGITPGSGVGNAKKRISEEETDTFTVGIGVPTVISSSTLIYNALEKSGVNEISPKLEEILENNRSFLVSPKNIDLISAAASKLIAKTITYFAQAFAT